MNPYHLTMIGILFASFAFLQIADAATTYYIIRHSVGHERNAVMAWIFSKVGLPAGLLLPKMVAVGGMYMCVLPTAYATYILGALVMLYSWVIFNNVGVIRRR
jgi:hypothetical protein